MRKLFLVVFLSFFSFRPLHALSVPVSTAVMAAASSSSGAVAARHAILAKEHSNRRRVASQSRHYSSKAVSVLSCTVYYEKVNGGYIYEGCNLGSTWSPKFVPFDVFIDANAPGFELEYFVLNTEKVEFEMYLKKRVVDD